MCRAKFVSEMVAVCTYLNKILERNKNLYKILSTWFACTPINL